jgi:hypothetical protein
MATKIPKQHSGLKLTGPTELSTTIDLLKDSLAKADALMNAEHELCCELADKAFAMSLSPDIGLTELYGYIAAALKGQERYHAAYLNRERLSLEVGILYAHANTRQTASTNTK